MLEETIGELLRQHGFRLAIAESCTGGLLAHRITNVPGSSDYFVGGIVAYANEAKERLLGVHRETLATYGAVSRETAIEMAQGVRKVLCADIGLGITGIAGPGGGSPQKPVGLVWIGLSVEQTDDARRFLWSGDRLRVKEQSTQAALEWLLEYLHKGKPSNPEKANAGTKTGEIIQVVIKSNMEGRMFPQSFIWQGRTYIIDSVGRHWQDDFGQHFLVMVPGGKVFELIFVPKDGQWYLRSSGLPRMAA